MACILLTEVKANRAADGRNRRAAWGDQPAIRYRPTKYTMARLRHEVLGAAIDKSIARGHSLFSVDPIRETTATLRIEAIKREVSDPKVMQDYLLALRSPGSVNGRTRSRLLNFLTRHNLA